MKTQRIILFGLLVNVLVAQNPITVSNVPGVSADYNNLQTALDAAPDSSTIYVYASSSSYGDINISKPTFLYGAGMFPDTPGPITSKLGNVTFTTSQTDSSHGSILSGFVITSEISISNGLENIIIERNIGWNIVLNQTNNISIINNRLSVSSTNTTVITLNSCTNTNIINNYIRRSLSGGFVTNYYIIIGSDSFIVNNYFTIENYSTYDHYISGSNNIIENNIFNDDAAWGSISLSQFYNNMSAMEAPLGQNNNVGSGNIVGVPLFITTSFGDQNYYGLDWGSPGLEAGTDGTDLGIQGGFYVFSNAYMPPLPYVQQLQVPAVVPLNGSINVKITGKSHN